MWLSPRLVARSHSKFFNAVFQSAVVGSVTSAGSAAPLSPDQRARLDAAVAAATAEAAAAAKAARARNPLAALPSSSSATSEILSWLRWAFTEPERTRFPWYLRWRRRSLLAPLCLAFPLAPRLLSVRDTRDVAVDALRPWMKSKGLKVSKGGGRGGGSGSRRAFTVDDACFSRRRAWECRSFGAVAEVLGCVPVLSWLLAFATTAGAALWAADLEKFEGGSRVLVPPPEVPPPASGKEGGPAVTTAAERQATAVSASKQEL